DGEGHGRPAARRHVLRPVLVRRRSAPFRGRPV
ncbi:MAG: hypothetical protein AVDCRST_MAG54-3038, partial [uncultured Actinomycetospora sp.]